MAIILSLNACPGSVEHYSGILACARAPIHNSLAEGMNDRIDVIKRMAYGFEALNSTFLKSRPTSQVNTMTLEIQLANEGRGDDLI
jgi:hypothetical protein